MEIDGDVLGGEPIIPADAMGREIPAVNKIPDGLLANLEVLRDVKRRKRWGHDYFPARAGLIFTRNRSYRSSPVRAETLTAVNTPMFC
jgi:hypothetical protein